MLVAIKDVEGFKKDTKTQAIVSTDQTALAAYRTGRAKRRATQIRIEDENQSLREEINMLKEQFEELARLYKKMLDNK